MNTLETTDPRQRACAEREFARTVPPARVFLTTLESRIYAGLFFVMVVFRLLQTYTKGFSGDERQHLHVVWGWTRGLLQYRDFFDNHAPLFHILAAPFLAFFGERADIVRFMRIPMIPLFALSLWCAFLIGRRLFSARAGAWAALFIGCYPDFFVTMTECRTDVLWTALWLAAVATICIGEFKGARAFLAGLLLGADFAVSMKTSLLFGSLAIAAAITLAFQKKTGSRIHWPEALRSAALCFCGAVIVPGAITVFFASQGALGAMFYCVIQHNLGIPRQNVQPGVDATSYLLLPIWIFAAWRIHKHLGGTLRASRTSILMLTPAICIAVLLNFWTLITKQDFLPLIPIGGILLAPLLLAGADRLTEWRGLPLGFRIAVPIAIAFCQLAYIPIRRPPWRVSNGAAIRPLAFVLHISNPDDYVMDPKGETIFRQRPIYWVLEDVTKYRMTHHIIHDDIPERLIATRTCLVDSGRMKGRTLDFVNANYIQLIDRMNVAGKVLEPAYDDPNGYRFEIAIPARYVIVAEKGRAAGTLDGKPLDGSIELAAGPHEFVNEGNAGNFVIVWAQAVERGFSPFATK